MSSSSAKEATGVETEEDSNSVGEDSNKVSSSKQLIEVVKQIPRGSEKKGSDTSSSPTTNDPSSTSVATTTVAAGHKTSQSPDLPTAVAASQSVPRSKKKKRSAESRKEVSKKSATTTVETEAATRYPESQSGLPSLADAAAAAAPPVPRSEKKTRRRREDLALESNFYSRVMLDRESQNNSTIVHWSTDGNSFLIMDQIQFEEDIIPTYFDNPIIFASFQSKLYRWGFNRVSNRETGRHEFCSPAFRRLSVDNAVAAADPSSNAGVQVQQQQQQTLASSSLQALAQSNQQPLVPNSSNQANLISNIQQSSQQPLLSSQQPPAPVNNQMMNIQQWQHPNPIMNLLNTALGSQMPTSPLVTYSPAPSRQGNILQALASLYGISSSAGTFPNATTATPATTSSQPNNNMALQSLLTLMNRLSEDDRQRRIQADALQNAIIANIGQILGRGSGGGGTGTSATLNCQ